MSNGGLFITGIGCPNMNFEAEVIKSITGVNFQYLDWITRGQAYIQLSNIPQEQQDIRKMAMISREAHGSCICIIFRHDHCFYDHLWDIQKAAREVVGWDFFEKVKVVRLPGNCEINSANKQTIPLIKCMDGRSNMPAIQFFKKTLGVDVRIFTRPGANGLLVEPSSVSNQLLREIQASYNGHTPETLGISGHHDCRGNPVIGETHLMHLNHAVSTAKKWGEFKQIIPIFVNENWEAQPVLP